MPPHLQIFGKHKLSHETYYSNKNWNFIEIQFLFYVYIIVFYYMNTLLWAHCMCMGSILQSRCEAYGTRGRVLVQVASSHPAVTQVERMHTA